MEPRSTHRILVVDDHPLMRTGLQVILSRESDVEVVGEAATAEEALSIFDRTSPDVAIVDISLPGMSGLELTKHLRQRDPDVAVLVLSRHEETLYAERAIRAGARGYVMKQEGGDAIIRAVRRVAAGGIYVSEEINERLLMGIASGQNGLAKSPLEVLSDRELEVFELTGRGLGTREIAERLHLSIKTVESYRARIKSKLNLANAAELMQHAVQWVESEAEI